MQIKLMVKEVSVGTLEYGRHGGADEITVKTVDVVAEDGSNGQRLIYSVPLGTEPEVGCVLTVTIEEPHEC